MASVAGLDLAAGRGISGVAILECDDEALPRFIDRQSGEVVSDHDILAALTVSAPALIAIDAPLSLPLSVMAGLDAQYNDHLPFGSPYTRAAERDATWAYFGVRPLPVSFLGGLTFRAIALLPQLRQALPGAAIIEVFPTATLRLLGIGPHKSTARRLSKTTPVARTAVQSGLQAFVAGIPDSRDALLSADLLDALAAALTATFHLRGETQLLGNPGEGQIVVPLLPTS